PDSTGAGASKTAMRRFVFAGTAVVIALAPLGASAQWDRQPMTLYVAKGEPDACGPGCNEWIAADGPVDPDVVRRLGDLLDTLKGRNLPIMFNSGGGSLGT